MIQTCRSVFLVAASTFSSPAFAGSGFMGIPGGMSIGGMLLGFLIILVTFAVAGAAYSVLEYIVGKIRGRK